MRSLRRCLPYLIALAGPAWGGERTLALDNGHYAVPATLSMPDEAAAPVPAVLMLHGTGSSRDEVGGLYRRLAGRLAQSGIASIRIDFAGTGDSPVDHALYTLDSAQRDASTALAFLRAQPSVAATYIGVIGFSQGGLIAQRLALGDADIAAMVLWSSVAGDGIGPFAPLFERYETEARNNGFAVVDFPWREPLAFSHEWFEQVRASRTLSEFKRYTGPLLAIAGTADEAVPPESARQLIEAAGSTEASALFIKGADHIFGVLGNDPSQAETLIRVTVQWFEQQWGGTRAPARAGP